MTTWLELRQQVRRMLDDPETDANGNPLVIQWSDVDLLDYLGDALAELSAHTATRGTTTFTGDGVASTFSLPAEFLQIGMLLDDQSNKIEPAALSPGSYLPKAGDTGYRNYYIWPDGTLNLTWVPDVSDVVTLLYWMNWPIPAADGDVLSLPRWTERAIKYHMVGSAQVKRSTPTTLINEFRTRMDSGTPMMNPLTAYADWCYRQFREVLDRRPVQDRSYWYQMG